jgi:hypothetical protein
MMLFLPAQRVHRFTVVREADASAREPRQVAIRDL